MRYRWVLSSIAVGIIVLLLAYHMFSLAFSINSREYSMINKLAGYKDTTFDNLRGWSDVIWLAAVGSLITLLAGGMAATLLSRPDKKSEYKLLVVPAIVAIFTMIAIDAYIYSSWNDGMQVSQDRGAQYGPAEPMPFCLVFFIMLVLDGVCFVASAMGGLVVMIPKTNKN